MDEGFATYVVRGEGLYVKVDDLINFLVVTCYDKTSVSASECMVHGNVLQSTVTFYLKVGEVSVITCI